MGTSLRSFTHPTKKLDEYVYVGWVKEQRDVPIKVVPPVVALERWFQEKERAMKCTICKQGETRPGRTTVVLERGKTTVVIKDVPAEICENCGEYYLTEEMTAKVMEMAEEAVRHNAEIEVLRFAA
jgi:YgiT-type zinc finger domain-containing protein